MSDTKKILRNWKIVWTIIAIILSIFIIKMGVKYNFYYSDDIGWKMLEIDCSENNIGNITNCNIMTIASINYSFDNMKYE